MKWMSEISDFDKTADIFLLITILINSPQIYRISWNDQLKNSQI